jgi:hypothetical protein
MIRRHPWSSAAIATTLVAFITETIVVRLYYYRLGVLIVDKVEFNPFFACISTTYGIAFLIGVIAVIRESQRIWAFVACLLPVLAVLTSLR